MKKNLGFKTILLLVIASSICMFFIFDLGNYLTLTNLKDGLDSLKVFYVENKVLTMLIYFSIYFLISALSLPVAGITTLAGGALFGFFYGCVIA